MKVPYRSQYDGSPYQNANCGPASLAMVLEAYGVSVPNEQLRDLANQLQGTTTYNDGVALDYLQDIARQAGLRTEGLRADDGNYRPWTMGDVIKEVRHGYPVITLVHFASLPSHANSSSTSDHYIVIVGTTSSGFVVNDPASVNQEGYNQIVSPESLLAAWQAAAVHYQAVAFLPPAGQSGIQSLGLANASAGDAVKQVPIRQIMNVPQELAPPPPPPTPTAAPTAQPSPVPPPPSPIGDRARAWQHAAPLPTAGLPVSTVATTPTAAIVLAEHSSQPSSLPMSVAVVVFVGLAAIAIVRAPKSDELG